MFKKNNLKLKQVELLFVRHRSQYSKVSSSRIVKQYFFRFPGFRYENSGSESDHFLVLVFDANGILCGAQVALPTTLANPGFDYKNNPYYVEGNYDGSEIL